MITKNWKSEDQKNENDISVERSFEFRNRALRFYIDINDSTPRIDKKPYIDFIMELLDISNEKSVNLIKNGKVSINSTINANTTTELEVGDIIRVGSIGHFIKNNDGIAVVK